MEDGLLRDAVDLATFAPSLHNSQPWRFRLAPGRIDVLADHSRAVPVLDPDGRQLAMSCGAATEYLVLALRAAGRECTVDEAPDPADSSVIAKVVLGDDIVTTAVDRELARAAVVRHTHRGPFDDRIVPQSLVEQLREAARGPGAWLHVLHREDDRVALGALLDRATAAEVADPAYRREISEWRTEGTPDGIPDQALPAEAPRSSLITRDFWLDRQEAPPLTATSERPLIAVVVTDGDDLAAWVAAGRCLARALVHAAAAHVFASPLGQVTDLTWYRAALADSLQIFGHPQLVLRMGYAARGASPSTPRRTADEVIVRE